MDRRSCNILPYCEKYQDYNPDIFQSLFEYQCIEYKIHHSLLSLLSLDF